MKYNEIKKAFDSDQPSMTLSQALAIYIQVADLNSLGARTEPERQAHIVACEIIRHEADKAIAAFRGNK